MTEDLVTSCDVPFKIHLHRRRAAGPALPERCVQPSSYRPVPTALELDASPSPTVRPTRPGRPFSPVRIRNTREARRGLGSSSDAPKPVVEERSNGSQRPCTLSPFRDLVSGSGEAGSARAGPTRARPGRGPPGPLAYGDGPFGSGSFRGSDGPPLGLRPRNRCRMPSARETPTRPISRSEVVFSELIDDWAAGTGLLYVT